MISSTRYFQYSSSTYLRDQAARDLFSRVFAKGQWLKFWSFLARKPRRLLSLKCIDESSIEKIHQIEEIQSIPISQIRGSENRFYDFDCDFYPLNEYVRDRWLSIASIRLQGKNLPTVVLVQVGDLYFVRDGHHRISVARALREIVIEAKVIVLYVHEPLHWDIPTTLPASSPLDQLRDIWCTGHKLRCLWNRFDQHFIRKVLITH